MTNREIFENNLSYFKIKSRKNNSAQCFCPAHEDKKPSLTITMGDKCTLFNCHAHCEFNDILKAAGLEEKNTFYNNEPKKEKWIIYIESKEKKKLENYYNYVSPFDGKYLYTKIRLQGKDIKFGLLENGRFSYGLKGKKLKNLKGIYGNLQSIKKAITENIPIFIPEGEKDVDTLTRKGYIAWTYGSAGDWNPDLASFMAEAIVYILADNDIPGINTAATIQNDLKEIAKSCKAIIPIPDISHADITDYFNAGHTKEEFEQILHREEYIIKEKSISLPHLEQVQQEQLTTEKHNSLKQFDNKTNFTNASIQLKCGEWIGNENGVYQWAIEKKTGQPYKVYASRQQILLSGIIEDIETKEQQYCISFSSKRNNSYFWKTIYADPAICSSKTKIINLANHGIRVTDQTATQLVRYLDDLYTLNEDVIPIKESIRHLGWIGNKFFPYEQEIIFNGDSRQKEVVTAIHEHGNFETWKQLFKKLRGNLIFRLVTDTCLASVLIEKIGGLCFVLHLWGNTGKGKTVALLAAASLWGEPEKLLLSADTTDNYATGRASFFKNLPVLIDETQVTNNKLDKLIYLVTEGRTRGRLDRNGKERNNSTWSCAAVFTGEKPIINSKSSGGAANRVIELPVDESLFTDFGEVVDISQENYGFAGKKFVEYIQQQDLTELKKEYNQVRKEIISQSESTGKQVASLAFIILADRIANRCIFENGKPLLLKELVSILKTEEEISQAERAYDFIISWIAANPIYFQNTSTKILGRINKGFCYFNQSELVRLLSDNNFDFDAIKKDWATAGHLEKNSQGRYFHYTTISNTLKTQYVKIKVSEEESEFQDINKEKLHFR